MKNKITPYYAKVLRLLSLALFISVFFLQSCGPDGPEPEPEKNLQIKLNHIFGAVNVPFVLNNSYLDSVSGDTFVPTTLVYHINHFELNDVNGGILKLSTDKPYRMIDLADAGSFTPINVNLKESSSAYESISFTLGVEDSVTNAQGLLNAVFTSPMYWGMINGYIHFKLEGNLMSIPNKSIVLHVGGYLNPYALSRKITIPFTEPLSFSKGNATATLNMNLQKYFDGVNKINMNDINLIHQPGEDARKIADNWAGMFSDGGITYR